MVKNNFPLKAHFSSKLLLKEQMIIPVKTTLNNAGHIDAKLIDFSEIYQKKSSEIGRLLLIVSWRGFPWRNFPWNRPIFLRICPRKSFEIWLFPLKSPEIGRFFCEIWLFSRENSAKSADFSANIDFFPRKSREIGRFFREFAPENPAKFCFFSAKYQKPCLDYEANSSIILWVERNTQKCDNRICADDPLGMILVWKPQVTPSNNNNDFGKITVQSISVEFKIIVDKTGWCLSF